MPTYRRPGFDWETMSLANFSGLAPVFDVLMTEDEKPVVIGWSPACSEHDDYREEFENEPEVESLHSGVFEDELDVEGLHSGEIDEKADVESLDTDEIDDETFYEAYPAIRHIAMIDDREERAHNLLESGLCPHEHPRIEAFFRRTAAGTGYHSRMLAAIGF
jgi:hypothetical protein